MSTMSPVLTQMDSVIRRLRRRQRLRNVLRDAGRGVFLGAVLSGAAAIAVSVVQPEWVRAALWLLPLGLPALGLCGALVGALRRVDDLRVARALDRAAQSDDRFASALQLRGHHRRARAQMLLDDALAAIGGTPLHAALPLGTAGELKWTPVPLLVLAALLWLVPAPQRVVQAAVQEVTPEEWADVYADLRRALDELPPPETDEDQQMVDELNQLAELIRQQPDKKEALARLAELQTKWEQRQEALGMRNLSLRQAADALRSSAALSRFADQLRAGDYPQAAAELQALAQRLKDNQPPMTASDFEAAATDLDQLGKELQSHSELSQSCRNSASAASSMNRNKLADALNKLASCLQKNACNLKRSDRLCRSCNALDQLKRRLGRCGSCSNGACNAFVRSSNRKGGLRAGWGTADNWSGGALTNQGEERQADMIEAAENPGASTLHPTVSPEERARSSQEYRERYAELVRKAEADLALERVPSAYRDYLRKYFVAIRPVDVPAEPAEK